MQRETTEDLKRVNASEDQRGRMRQLVPRRPQVVEEGTLKGGLPYLAIGTGPPLIVFHGHYPTGMARRLSLFPLRDLLSRYTIYLISRRPGVLPGTTIADFATD